MTDPHETPMTSLFDHRHQEKTSGFGTPNVNEIFNSQNLPEGVKFRPSTRKKQIGKLGFYNLKGSKDSK